MDSGGEAGKRGSGNPLRDQLLVADEAIAGLLIRVIAVLLPQRGQLLVEGMVDRMVLVHGARAAGPTPRILTESKELARGRGAGGVLPVCLG